MDPGATDNILVLVVWRYGHIENITSKEMVSNLWETVVSIGEDILGIKKEDIGMHLIRSSAAMAM